MKAAVYPRVSTTDQSCELQLKELREYILRRGWESTGEFVDTGWSGAKASRPEFDRLMAAAGKREFDVVLCWKLDRFGRSLLNCKTALQQLQSQGVRFIATSQNIDTDESNPAARFLPHILMAAAEFERELIRERSAAGLRRYRSEYESGNVGKETRSRSGKNLPVGRPRKVFDRQKVIELRSQGLSPRRIASEVGPGGRNRAQETSPAPPRRAKNPQRGFYDEGPIERACSAPGWCAGNSTYLARTKPKRRIQSASPRRRSNPDVSSTATFRHRQG